MLLSRLPTVTVWTTNDSTSIEKQRKGMDGKERIQKETYDRPLIFQYPTLTGRQSTVLCYGVALRATWANSAVGWTFFLGKRPYGLRWTKGLVCTLSKLILQNWRSPKVERLLSPAMVPGLEKRALIKESGVMRSRSTIHQVGILSYSKGTQFRCNGA